MLILYAKRVRYRREKGAHLKEIHNTQQNTVEYSNVVVELPLNVVKMCHRHRNVEFITNRDISSSRIIGKLKLIPLYFEVNIQTSISN